VAARKSVRSKAGQPKRSRAETVRRGPTLEVAPKRPRADSILYLRGKGWGACPIEVTIDGELAAVARVSVGVDAGGALLPAPDGSFDAAFLTIDLRPGRHRAAAKAGRRTKQVSFSVVGLAASERGGEGEKPYARARAFFSRRFGLLGAVPPGLRQFQVAQVRELRARAAGRGLGAEGAGANGGRGTADGPFGDGSRQPMPGVCNWTPLGPSGVVYNPTYVFSGRTLSIAFDPTTPSTVYVGTAGGGVWKTVDGGENWTPKSDYQVALAIGAIAVDPNQSLHVLAGTGEYDNYYIGTYYGNGILRSDDGGDSWSEVGGATFQRAEVSRIAFDPTDSTGQRVLLSSSVGVFESGDGGSNWTLLRAGAASDLVVFHPGGPPNRLTAIAAFESSGLWTSTRQGGAWGAWTQLTGAAFPTTFDRITMGQQRSDPKVIYALFGNGWNVAGIARTLDGATWTKVDIRLNSAVGSQSSTVAGHFHGLTIPAADLTATPSAAHTYATTAAGSPSHTHSLSLTAAQIGSLAAGAAVTVTTTPDATGHQHTFGIALTAQLGYDMCIGVHPTDQNTVFFGETRLWRNATGGGVFDPLPILHTDEHAFTFEPGSTTTCWVCGDGGVFRSTDGGNSWANRNRDLATLEYISLAQHPQWETVLIGGTQDNGTHRYSGSPAWRFVDGGDGGFSAIDPVAPTRMYHEYTGTGIVFSDDAGMTWNPANAGLEGAAASFYSPFEIDPTNHNVCYFGGFELWRRDFSVSGAWSAVTSGIGEGITAIAVDPSDGNSIYVATWSGKVWHLQRTGATWAPADVPRNDFSVGLPTVSISDLAIDSGGVVWASVSSVYASESFGEFSNDHVFRRAPTDASFVSRSTGLAQANPVNAIVIDPINSNRLFCGCDVGVFRTETAGTGAGWAPWDQGIPNVPVFDLELHAPRRLLRAATHGRSIWERPIDAISCPMVDLYIRDDVVDSGRVQPTPSDVLDPLSATGAFTYWWQSPDVKVDAPEPTYQTATPITDYVSFEAAIVHRTARRGRVNRFYVQVHNRGINKTTNVQVRAFFAAASAGLPSLPADFWSAGNPFVGTPSGPAWTPIGPARTIPLLEPAKPAIVEWDWTIPTGAAEHSCLLVLTTSGDDALNGGGILDPGQLVVNRKQVGLKNLHILDPVPGGSQPGPGQAIVTQLHNGGVEPMLADVLLHWGSLPPRARVSAVLDRGKVNSPTPKKRAPTREFPVSIDAGCEGRRTLDRTKLYALHGGKPGAHVLVAGVVIPADSWRAIAIRLELPRRLPPAGVQFDVLQRVGGRIVGGSTYRIENHPRPAGSEAGRGRRRR
jgi:hypothetical protein